ncbi:MAG: GNAT family N-acetyltransferase [Deltaproteobacteria bacterium]|nr:GNAT family N-acetyltransferase [Deltaproteobacteria bacterium]
MSSEPPNRVAFEPISRRLADGTEVRLRLIDPDDGPLLVELFYTLSPESIYNRFLTPVHRVDHRHIKRLVDIDMCIQVALVACIDAGDHWRIVGVARYHRNPENMEEAEVAIIVGDPWQGRGIGGMLLQEIGNLAISCGINRFSSTVNPGNAKLLRFAESYGYESTKKYEDGLLKMETELRV